MKENGIRLIQIGLRPNKEPFVEVQHDKIEKALLEMLDQRNHPMLVHCNSGKHRTGTLIGCLRKLQRWCLSAIFAEYIRFSSPKHRVLDQQFIELMSLKGFRRSLDERFVPDWAGLAFTKCSGEPTAA